MVRALYRFSRLLSREASSLKDYRFPYHTKLVLTLNRMGVSESGKAGGGILPPCVTSLFKGANDHEIWCYHTMSKALPGNNKTFDDVMTMMFL